MRASGGQAKTACGNLQMYEGLEAGIEGSSHAVGQKRQGKSKQKQREEEARRPVEEEETDIVAVGIENLNIETAGTEEEAPEDLNAALRMDIE